MKKVIAVLFCAAALVMAGWSEDFVRLTCNGFDYEIGTTEVTQKLYEEVMGKNPSYFKGENRPVETLSWLDCIIFCNKLSMKEGLTPCYSFDGSTDPSDWNWDHMAMNGWNHSDWADFNKRLDWDIHKDGYRLPYVDEWKKAAKGGKYTKYSGSNDIFEVSWFGWCSGDETHDVGQKKANGYGLYDMSGNVAEWCWDRNIGYHSCLGGNYASDREIRCLIDDDYSYQPNHRYSYSGLRLARTVK